MFGLGRGRALVSWYDRRRERGNLHCLYCSEVVGAGSTVTSNKEHLIGRKLVPPGSFEDADAFNFHFRACERCNTEKGKLEDHVAAISLLYSPGRGERDDVNTAALHKAAQSFDPAVRGTPIAEVRHDHQITMGPFTFGLVSGPQLKREYAAGLAFYQVQGLFSLVTSSDPLTSEGTRLLPAEHFHCFDVYPYRDWGNPWLVEAGLRARKMISVVEIDTAGGYFRASLRPSAEGWWFWALEWNKSFRVVGWIGSEEVPPPFASLPDAAWHYHEEKGGRRTRVRLQVPHDPENDVLFEEDEVGEA